MMKVTRLALRNYKSIAACDVQLIPLTILVGANGAGKSNFLDALRFTAQALRFSLDHALWERAGISEVRRRSRGHPTHFRVRLEFELPEAKGWYALEVGARPQGHQLVRKEECVVNSADGDRTGHFRVRDGRPITASFPYPPGPGNDRLYLMQVAGYPAFRPVYEALAGMSFYDIQPEQVRMVQPRGPADLLAHDGGNVASVLARLKSEAPGTAARIVQYLSKIVPEAVALDSLQGIRGQRSRSVPVDHLSEGTLRVLGVLTALLQIEPGNAGPGLIGIERPEASCHPAASGVLADVLLEASQRAQVVVTSQSADLLDLETIPCESILVAVSEDGATRLGRLDETSRSMLRDNVFTAGELLRMDQLSPDLVAASA